VGRLCGGSFHEGSFHGGRDIAIRGRRISQHCFKKRSEIKYKKTTFSTESKQQHQNLKRTENITYMIGFTPLSIPCFLEAKDFLVLS
jgi:hypothetical protein